MSTLMRKSIFRTNFFSRALRASVPPNCASKSSGDSALEVECWYWMDVFSDFSRSADAMIVTSRDAHSFRIKGRDSDIR